MSNLIKRPALAGTLLLLLAAVVIWLGAFLLESGNKSEEQKSKGDSGLVDKAHRATTPSPLKTTALAPAADRSSQDQKAGEDNTGSDRISEIIANPNLDFPSAVNRLLEILPGLKEADQEEAAHHIANLSDEKSAAQWSAMLVANQLPAPAADVLFDDLLNRPQEMNMPVLASIADQPAHPKNKDSAEILETLYGTPPQGTAWKDWIKTKLAEEANK
jgi:hypothetical protein